MIRLSFNKRIMLRRAAIVAVAGLATLMIIRVAVHISVRDRIYTDIRKVPSADVAMVLGTKALPNGRLSDRLASRCDKAIELYKAGKAKTLLMSGDNRPRSNCESESMRRYAIDHGVPHEDVTIDGLGLRTYDSMYRARHVFGIKRLIVVTQGFHMDRSLLYCKAMRIDAYGVAADLPPELRDRFREPLAVLMSLIDIYILHPQVSTKPGA